MGIPCCVVIWAAWRRLQGKGSTCIVPSFLSYFKTLNSCPVLGIEPLISYFAIKLYTNWVNFVVLKSYLILLLISCLYYSTVRQGWVDCPSCISVYSTCIMFICDGCGTRQRLDSVYIWMAKKVLWEKSLRFLVIWMTGCVNLYHWLLKFITYCILTGGFWVLRLHFRIASQLSSLLMNLKVLHTVLWKGRNTDILLPGLFYHHIPLTVPVTRRVQTIFFHSGLLLPNWISVQLFLSNWVFLVKKGLAWPFLGPQNCSISCLHFCNHFWFYKSGWLTSNFNPQPWGLGAVLFLVSIPQPIFYIFKPARGWSLSRHSPCGHWDMLTSPLQQSASP